MALSQVREADLDALYDAHTNIANRGAFFPLGVMSRVAFRSEFAEHGFWQKAEGMLVIRSREGEIAGHIEFFRPVSTGTASSFLPALRRPVRRAWVRDRVGPAADRLPLRREEGAPDPARDRSRNGAVPAHCREVWIRAERNARGAFFNDGRNQDVLLYSLLRTDPRPWHQAG